MSLRRFAALCCLLSLLLGTEAQAKSLLVYPHADITATADATGRNQQARNVRLVGSIIRATGGTFSQVSAINTKTEWMRTGAQVWNSGWNNGAPATLGAGAYAEQFDAVIYIGNGGARYHVGTVARPDSLTRLTKQGASTATALAVPMLQLRDNLGPVVNGTQKFGATTDSVGFTGEDAGPGKAIYFAGDRNAFLTHAYVSGGTGIFETGDLRRILYGGTPAYEYRHGLNASGTGPIPCGQCDSLASYAANDTLILWDRQYSTRLGQASTMVFAEAFGAGSATDSLANADVGGNTPNPATEGDFAIILCALAHLDSLVRATSTTGGKVLGDKVIKIAPIVYGGLARSLRSGVPSPGSAQGIAPGDTVGFYAGLDSLASLTIPVTFAVNVDSAASYARDIIKLRGVPLARFTPQIWNGITDSSHVGGTPGNLFYNPTDVFGRYRQRYAVGDSSVHTIATNDTSICALAQRSLALADSLFPGRVSRVAVAPDDDWSPFNVSGVLAANAGKVTFNVSIDSVLYALQLAGFQGIVADAQDPNCDANTRNGSPAKTNPRGYYNRQRMYSSATVAGLRNFKILTHTGSNLGGGWRQAMAFDDSTQALGGWTGSMYKEIARVWSGALLDFDNSYDTWPYDDITSGGIHARTYDDVEQRKVDRTLPGVRHGSVYRLSCGDLSGATNGPTAMTAFHVLKAVRNAMLAINKLAGRTVVTFSYPEDIDP